MTSELLIIDARVLVDGDARGQLLWTDEPLSFWGGYDQATGEIIDRRHPLSGRTGAGLVMAVPFTRGSSTTTSILLEAVRAGVAPAAVITTGPDSFLSLAAIAARELYGHSFPVLSVDAHTFSQLSAADEVEISAGGKVRVLRNDQDA